MDNTINCIIVDDDIQVSDFIKEFIHMLYPMAEVTVLTEGYSADEIIAKSHPNIVFLDLHLPGRNGFDLCKIIKQNEQTSNAKVIIMTGYHSDENKSKAFENGAEAYLAKPFEIDQLRETLNAIMV